MLNQSNERNATILDGRGRLAALSVGISQFTLSPTLPVRFALDLFREEGLDPAIPKNEGFLDAIELVVPKGCVLNPPDGRTVSRPPAGRAPAPGPRRGGCPPSDAAPCHCSPVTAGAPGARRAARVG